MMDQDKSKQQLINELAELRQRVAALESVESERQRTDELARSKAVLEATIENLPFDFWAIGPDGRYTMQNAASKAHWGSRIGKTPEDAAPDTNILSLWLDNNRRAFAGEKIEEEVNVTVNNEQRVLNNVIVPIWQGERISGILGVNIDITERKRAEAALRESETRFRSLFQDSAIGTVVVTPKGSFVQANQAFCEFLGYSESELLGKTVVSITHPKDREATAAAIRQALASGPRILRFDKRYLHKDGHVLWGEASATLICDAEDNPNYFITQVLDITERKRAEDALQKAHDELEQRVKERTAELAKVNENLDIFRKFAEASSQGFGMGDLDGRIAYVNPALCRLFGEGKPEDLVGKSFMDHYPEEWRERRKNEVLPILEREGRWQGEMPVRGPHGRLIPTLHHIFLMRDEDERPVRRAVVVTDITERKRAEEALRQSEDRYRAVVEDQTEVIARFKADGTLIFVNDVYCRFFAKSRQELLGSKWHPAALPEDVPMIEEQLGAISPGNPVVVIENRVYSGLGDVRWMQFINRGFFDDDGRLTEMQAVGRDITERKRAEEALRQSERRFRNYFDQGLIGMAVTSLDKRWLEVNDRLCEMLGYSREELTRTNWTAITHPDDVEPNLRVFNPLLAGEIEHFTLNKRYLKRDGSIVHTTIYTRAFRKEDGTIDHIITLIEDITARKQAEKALERERQSLWRMLQASDHERQTISYEIHDGLAQYLAAAIMQFQSHEALRENSPDVAKKAYETAVELVRQSHSEARRLISEVRPPVIDENGLETAISHLVHEQRRHGGPKIECLSSVQFGRLPPILENALYRIAQEALTNACKHSESKKVTVTMTQEGQEVRLEVQDWGIGFDPEAVGEGHFGLEGIRQRVRLLGGRLNVESKDPGTLVQVVVPILERPDGMAESRMIEGVK